MTKTKAWTEADVSKPFIGEDGLEYADWAGALCGTPVECERNERVLAARAVGVPEEEIQAWIKRFDGDDPTPSHTLP